MLSLKPNYLLSPQEMTMNISKVDCRNCCVGRSVRPSVGRCAAPAHPSATWRIVYDCIFVNISSTANNMRQNTYIHADVPPAQVPNDFVSFQIPFLIVFSPFFFHCLRERFSFFSPFLLSASL